MNASGDSLESPHWYRASGLRLRLREHVRVHRHVYRGRRWYLLQDAASGRCHRASPAAHRLLSLLDGERSLGEAWLLCRRQLGEEAPSQAETLQLLGQLHTSDLLWSEVAPDASEVFDRHRAQRRASRGQRWRNPLFLRLPLLDPDAFLEAALPFVRPLLGLRALVGWGLLVSIAGLLAFLHWDALSAPGADAVLRPQALLWLVLCYVGMKALHELAHAFVIKRSGGEVHELGVMLLVLLPVPYVDASASAAFPDERERIAVSAAGILAELAMASLALFVWLAVEPGLVQSIAWNLMAIGGISTLLFNGNPLLRFDGYYVLSDWLQIPNLAERSRRFVAAWMKRRVLGAPEAPPIALDRSEARWLAAYGVASTAYRFAVLLTICLFVAAAVPVVGRALAAWTALLGIVVPAVRGVAGLWGDPGLRRRPVRAAAGAAAVLAVAGGLLFALPLPLATGAEGIVWPPERSQLRAESDAFVLRVLAVPGSRVEAGQPLVETEDPLLAARVAVLEARRRELRAAFDGQKQEDRVAAAILRDELATLEADLQWARERLASTLIRSPAAGHFVLPRADDWPGRFVRRGEVLGWVADLSEPTVRAVIPEASVDLVTSRTYAVTLRPAEQPGVVWTAGEMSAVPAATTRLASLALGAAGGGGIAVDRRDESGLTSSEPVFEVDLVAQGATGLERMGGRVFVRFDHGAEPLAGRVGRALRRLLLGRLGV